MLLLPLLLLLLLRPLLEEPLLLGLERGVDLGLERGGLERGGVVDRGSRVSLLGLVERLGSSVFISVLVLLDLVSSSNSYRVFGV